MRIKDFTDTIRHLTDPFNIPEARRMIQENPALSREQFAEGQSVGIPTKEVTQYGRRIYETPEGEEVSEKSTTFFLNGLGWINIPSIHGGRAFNDDQLRGMIKRGVIEPTSVHQSKLEAEEAAGSRSNMMKRYEKGFAGGQLVQPGPGRQGYQGKPHYNIKKLKYTGDSTLRSVTKGRRKGQWAWQTTEDGKRVSKFSKKKPIVEQKGPWTARIKNKGVFYADTKVNLLKKIADYQKGLIKPSKTIDYPLVEGLVFRANQQNKFKNVTDIAKEYAKITRSKSLPAFSEGSHTKNIVDLLDTREEKVERVLTDLLASDQPIDSSIVKKTVTKDFKTSPWKALRHGGN